MSHIRLLARLRALLRPVPPSSQGSPADAFPDIDWGMLTANLVTEEMRDARDVVCRRVTPRPVCEPLSVSFDAERGSFSVLLPGQDTLVLAVWDDRTAEQIESAFRLGGLGVALRHPSPGVVRVLAFFESFCFSLDGHPALTSIPSR